MIDDTQPIGIALYQGAVLVIRTESPGDWHIPASRLQALIAPSTSMVVDTGILAFTLKDQSHAVAAGARIAETNLREALDFWFSDTIIYGTVPDWIEIRASRTGIPGWLELSPWFGIVIRQEPLRARGIALNLLVDVFEGEGPLDVTHELVSFGPNFDGEAAEVFLQRLGGLGLSQGTDMFLMADDVPEWLVLNAALVEPEDGP